MSEELKPCPFCGSEPEVHETDNGTEMIVCSNPRCSVFFEDSQFFNGNIVEIWNDARDKWNTRKGDKDG